MSATATSSHDLNSLRVVITDVTKIKCQKNTEDIRVIGVLTPRALFLLVALAAV